MENKPDIEQLKQVVEGVSDLRFINEGGFKAVYEATISGNREALKVVFIPRDDDQSEEHSEIFLRAKREIESLERLESPYIVKLGSKAPCLYIIQGFDYLVYSEEFLEGQTLNEKIREAYRPDFIKCKTLLVCLLKVISELKAKDIIHRDIKPENVFVLDIPSRPYVTLDLGIAFKFHSTAITRNRNVRIGTLPYMAPEMFNPNFRTYLDYRSDLYSAALTTYEYASGIHPFARRGEDDYTTIYRVTNIRPTPLSQHRSDLPSPFSITIDHLIRKNPALRPSNLEELIELMEVMS